MAQTGFTQYGCFKHTDYGKIGLFRRQCRRAACDLTRVTTLVCRDDVGDGQVILANSLIPVGGYG